MAATVIVPMLAQRLLINMRKVDYMGSQPVASKLLFAPPVPGSEDDLEEDFDAPQMKQEPCLSRRGGYPDKGPETGELEARAPGV